jgi:hypothetical protein
MTAPFLTTEEAASYLGFSSSAAMRMAISRGTVKASARRGRRLLFRTRDPQTGRQKEIERTVVAEDLDAAIAPPGRD